MSRAICWLDATDWISLPMRVRFISSESPNSSAAVMRKPTACQPGMT